MSAPTATYSARLRYRGAGFHGVALQPGLRTVGQTLVDAVVTATGARPVALVFAARTDAGVDARDQVASFRLTPAIEPAGLRQRLNATLPADLRVSMLTLEPRSFHARNSAVAKRYRYRILAGVTTAASADAWCVAPRIDVARMRAVAQELVGTRDFSALRHPRCSARNPVRTITAIRVRTRELRQAQFIVIDVEGDGFLRQMVRILAGTLASCGAGWVSPDDVVAAVARGDRSGTGPAAPAHGLTLMRVFLASSSEAAELNGSTSADRAPS